VVYGDWAGAVVDERSETRSTSTRGLSRLAAEAAWGALGWPLHVFRLAGIYGPGRNALETVRKGKARIIDKPDQVFSRIHVAGRGLQRLR
jgi:nucleoside-diphosphate-sugar epimerase